MAGPLTKQRKSQIGGFKPMNTIDSKPGWLNGTRSAGSKPAPKRTASSTLHVRDSDAPASAYRERVSPNASTRFPESASKRQKLASPSRIAVDIQQVPLYNGSESDDEPGIRKAGHRPLQQGFNNFKPILRNDSFRQVEATVKPRSNGYSKSSAHAYSEEPMDTRADGRAVLGDRSSSKRRQTNQKSEGVALPVKNVASPALDKWNNERGRDLNGTTRPSSSPKRRVIDDEEASNASADEPVFNGFDDSSDELAHGISGNAAFIKPTWDFLAEAKSKRQVGNGSPSRIQATQDGQMRRGESRRSSIDSSDPLQAEGPLERHFSPKRHVSVAASRTSTTSNARPQVHKAHLGDGFDEAERPLIRSAPLPQANGVMATGLTGMETANQTYPVKDVIICGTRHEVGVRFSFDNIKRVINYVSPSAHGSIDTPKLTRVVWGDRVRVRFKGPLDTAKSKTAYDVQVEFSDEAAFNLCKSNCSRWIKAGLHARDWVEASDGRLHKEFNTTLRDIEKSEIQGREEHLLMEKRHQKQKKDDMLGRAAAKQIKKNQLDLVSTREARKSNGVSTKLKDQFEGGSDRATNERRSVTGHSERSAAERLQASRRTGFKDDDENHLNEHRTNNDHKKTVKTYSRPPGTSPLDSPQISRTTRSKKAPAIKVRYDESPTPERYVVQSNTTPYSKTGRLGQKWAKSLRYPEDAASKYVATVSWEDLETLDEDAWLNDSIVWFGLRRALEHADPHDRERIHIFNSYFFSALTNQVKKGEVINYDAVRRWTAPGKLARKSLFEYDFVVVPVNTSGHWYVAIVCNVQFIRWKLGAKGKHATPQPDAPQALLDVPRSTRSAALRKDDTVAPSLEQKTSMMSIDDDLGSQSMDPILEENGIRYDTPTRDGSENASPRDSPIVDNTGKRKRGPEAPIIITLDSLGGAHADVTRVLKEYLKQEAQDKLGRQIENIPHGMTAKGIPLQPNFSDCGLYLIAYVEQFLKDPEFFVDSIVRKTMNEATYWCDFDALTLRDRTRSIVVAEGKKQNGIALSAEEEEALKQKDIITPSKQKRPPSPMLTEENVGNEQTMTSPLAGRQNGGMPKPQSAHPDEASDADDEEEEEVNETVLSRNNMLHDNGFEARSNEQPHRPTQITKSSMEAAAADASGFLEGIHEAASESATAEEDDDTEHSEHTERPDTASVATLRLWANQELDRRAREGKRERAREGKKEREREARSRRPWEHGMAGEFGSEEHTHIPRLDEEFSNRRPDVVDQWMEHKKKSKRSQAPKEPSPEL